MVIIVYYIKYLLSNHIEVYARGKFIFVQLFSDLEEEFNRIDEIVDDRIFQIVEALSWFHNIYFQIKKRTKTRKLRFVSYYY